MPERNYTIRERLASLETTMKGNQEALKKLTDAIYGNGKLGLIAELSNLNKALETHLEAMGAKKADRKWIITTIIAIAGIITSITIALSK